MRSPTPAESAHDLEEEAAAAFFVGADAGLEAEEGFLLVDDALVDAAAAVARRDERRAGVVVAILVKSSFRRGTKSEITFCSDPDVEILRL